MPWPFPKQPRYLPNEHNALSPLFVLQQEAKSPGSTCQRDWHWTNTQLEKLLAWKGLLPKWTRQTAQDGSQEHRGEATCQSREEPGCPSSSHDILLIHCPQLLPFQNTCRSKRIQIIKQKRERTQRLNSFSSLSFWSKEQEGALTVSRLLNV